MTARQLAREIYAFPATITICAIWIAIFSAYTYTEFAAGNPFLTRWRWLMTGFGGGSRFGDLTLEDFRQAQFWRLLTCTFLHYSLLHVVLNLLAMYQLGTMVESWYGSAQVVFIYGLTGGLGNLVSALIRQGIGSNPSVHSAGGSVVILGLVGMCAVAGWRSKRRIGRLLARQMGLVLVFTAVLGLALPNFLDNWGHAGGALVGAVIGFFHQGLIASQSKPSAWGSGILTGLVIAGCGMAQLIENRRETPALIERKLVARSDFLMVVEGTLNLIGRLALGHGNLAMLRDMMLPNERFLNGPTRDEIDKLRRLTEAARGRTLSEPEQVALQQRTLSATALLLRWYEHAFTGAAREEIEALRPLIETALMHPLSEPEQAVLKARLAEAIRAIRREYQVQQEQLRQLPKRGRAVP